MKLTLSTGYEINKEIGSALTGLQLEKVVIEYYEFRKYIASNSKQKWIDYLDKVLKTRCSNPESIEIKEKPLMMFV